MIDFLSPRERSLRVQVFFDLYMEGYIKHESINTKTQMNTNKTLHFDPWHDRHEINMEPDQM